MSAADITNDLRLAAQLTAYDARAQATLRQATAPVATPAPTPIERTSAARARAAAASEQQKAKQAAAARKPVPGTGLNAGTYNDTKAFKDRDGDGRAFEINR